MDVHVADEPAVAAARTIARRLRDAHGRRGVATLALSGGSAAPAMIAALLLERVAWEVVTVWQVDERIAPDGDPDRNGLQLESLPCTVRLMPVTAADLRGAAARYARSLPDRFDIIHLGVGEDGHTASWPPGNDAVLGSERLVELVPPFNGRRRMTLTPRVVNSARARLVFATGAGKRPVIARWLGGDRSLPIANVRRTGTTVVLDPAAAPGE
ncbi:MAG TPA: 6-phosphogluconolactonase [Ilumatobacter sp.]|nr:6-phosphogluconolactonase [Ilumatobacter sp.]